MEKFDVVVIGGGPGGYPAAIRAAQLGASVALVEKERLGGTCLNWGCIPTKSLIAASSLLEQARNAEAVGLRAERLSFDFAAMSAHKDAVVEQLRQGVTQLLKGNGVRVLPGVGAFLGRNRIAVRRGKKQKVLNAGATVIASGSTSTMPGFLPKSRRVCDSRAFLSRKRLPDSMIVLGGGVIGCEFACMAAQLGVEVTVVEMLEDILLVLDRDVRRELKRHMEQELRIRVLTGAPLKDIEVAPKSLSGSFGREKLDTELLLVSVGRQPVTAGLGLPQAGVEIDEGGFIPIDEYCRTQVATVYAVGDVTAGTTQLAHAATSQGLTAAENACGHGRRKAETLVPACIFTSPEIGAVGMTEQGARQRNVPVKTGKFPFAALGKALATGESRGFVKWVAHADTGQLLGAHAVGPHATDLIAEPAAAIRAELTVEEIGRTVHCHPTYAEAWMEAAHAVHGECIHAAPKRV